MHQGRLLPTVIDFLKFCKLFATVEKIIDIIMRNNKFEYKK